MRDKSLKLIAKKLKSERNPVSIEMIRLAALKFKHRGSFKKAYPSYYKKALEIGELDNICLHMIPATRQRQKPRSVYCYEFLDKTVYVGLSGDLERRHASHLKDERSQVFKKIHTGTSYVYRILEEKLEPSLASLKEQEWAVKYIAGGYALLNKAKCGNLGGNDPKWTQNVVLKIALKYTYLGDFRRENECAYLAALKNGWLKELSLLKRKRDWEYEELREIALNCKTISEFRRLHPNAYATAYNRELLDGICSHMRRVPRK